MDFFAVPPRVYEPARFIEAFDQTVKLAEKHGFRGILLFDGAQVPFSPWVLAQKMLAQSKTLLPLVAVGPAYVSVEHAARLISNLHHLYGRPLAINLVAGVEAKTGSHDERYRELQQFSATLDELLAQRGGSQPHQDPVAMRFVAGHSQDAVALAARLGAANLRMLASTLTSAVPAGCGLNFGVVARETSADAWAQAHRLYPPHAGAGRVAQRVAARTDSTWKVELLTEAEAAPGYWRGPAQSLKADSPFYVGSYGEVARLFADCRNAAVSALLLDLPPVEDEYAHFLRAFELSQRLEPDNAHQ